MASVYNSTVSDILEIRDKLKNEGNIYTVEIYPEKGLYTPEQFRVIHLCQEILTDFGLVIGGAGGPHYFNEDANKSLEIWEETIEGMNEDFYDKCRLVINSAKDFI